MGMKFLLILPPTDWLTGPNLHPHQHRVAIHRGHGTFSTRLQKIDDSMMSTHVQITEKPGATLHKTLLHSFSAGDERKNRGRWTDNIIVMYSVCFRAYRLY